MRPAQPPEHPPRILIVDDDPALRLLTAEALAGLRADITEAADGEAALREFRRRTADIVLLDLRMPGLDGFSVCQQLRTEPGGGDATIVMVTGLDDAESIRRAYELGATDFITKPINWAVLPERIRFLLRVRETFQELKKSETRLNEAQRIASLGYWEWDIHEDSLHWSEQIYSIFGIAPEAFEATKEGFMKCVHPDDREAVREAVRRALEEDITYSVDHRVVRPNGEIRIVHEQAEVRRDAEQTPVSMLGTVHDITERKQAEERIHRLAYYDSLTGLPNRHLFREIAEHALSNAKRLGLRLALLNMDIDRFSRINETLGHGTGDLLLQSIAERISRSIRGSDLISGPGKADSPQPYALAHVGGDEFLVLLAGLGKPTDAPLVARRLLNDLAAPLPAGQGEYMLTASIGIALFPEDCSELDTLLRYAGTSLHLAKAAGGNCHRCYSSDMNEHSHRRLSMEAHLHRALDQQELELRYQPQFHIADGHVVGLEALLRWQRPDEGSISPAEFIPLAEESGLIVPIGEWVIHETCRQIAAWQAQGHEPVPVAINLSARQFAEANLMQIITGALSDHGLHSNLLELELTESLIMQDPQAASKKLWAFHETGLRIAVDDFGTGYSSMSYLKRFPLDILKIDRSFVQDVSTDSTDAAIVRAIIALAKALGLTTLAEGVETRSQLHALSSEGCEQFQGFLASRPVQAERVYPLITAPIAISATDAS